FAFLSCNRADAVNYRSTLFDQSRGCSHELFLVRGEILNIPLGRFNGQLWHHSQSGARRINQDFVSVEFVVQMRISRVVGDEPVVLASESFQVFTCLLYLLLVSVETNYPGLILRQLAEIRHLPPGRAV